MDHVAAAYAQCKKCLDSFILEWDYHRGDWEEVSAARKDEEGKLLHRCGGRIEVWSMR